MIKGTQNFELIPDTLLRCFLDDKYLFTVYYNSEENKIYVAGTGQNIEVVSGDKLVYSGVKKVVNKFSRNKEALE